MGIILTIAWPGSLATVNGWSRTAHAYAMVVWLSPPFWLRLSRAGFSLMQFLECVALVLVIFALTVHLYEKGWNYWRDRRRLARLVNDHPEMDGVDPDEDSLFVFESDDTLKTLVLNNEEPGSNEPFDASEEDIN